MFDAEQFKEYIIRPALKAVNLYSESAEQLLFGTACAESSLGTYVHQIEGPALGVFQMEPATHDDIWTNYLVYRQELEERINMIIPYRDWGFPNSDLLITDLRYSAIMARLVYRRSPDPLPEKDDWEGHAAMWKRVYNTVLGAGTEDHFLTSIELCNH